MTKEETLVLFRRGKEEWNAWAQKMVATRKDTMEWHIAALADFEGIEFAKGDTNFAGWVFPGEAKYNAATFPGETSFDDTIFECEVSFKNTKFFDTTRFHRTRFKAIAWFSSPVEFQGKEASESGARFEGKALFNEAVFEDEAWFSSVTFMRDVQFIKTTFARWARFDDVGFQRHVQFTETTFKQTGDSKRGKPGEGGVWFAGATFNGQLWFDDVQIRRARSEPRSSKKKKTRIDDPAKWRAMRRLAVQGHDHERELDFFAGEIWSTPMSSIRFWFGLIYWALSRHGRSIFLPVCWWLALTVTCGYFYL